MNIDDLTIGQMRQIQSLIQPQQNFEGPTKHTHPFIGRYVVTRSYAAGVHLGILSQAEGKEVLLRDSRRLYYWEGAFTLSAVAVSGIESGKVSCVVPEIYLSDICEIIPCSKEAETNLRLQKVHVG